MNGDHIENAARLIATAIGDAAFTSDNVYEGHLVSALFHIGDGMHEIAKAIREAAGKPDGRVGQ